MGISEKDPDKRYTFVTVVHEAEYPLLLVQARSMRIYCPLDLIESIIIIDNYDRTLSPRSKKRLYAEYGHLANYLKFVSFREIGQMSYIHGYDRQQILKLMISHSIVSERYILLDAKNHLVFTLTRGFFEAPDGRVPINGHDYENDILRPTLETTLSYLEVGSRYIFNFTGCHTPFVMDTMIARELINYCVTREGKPFECIFAEKTSRFLDFFLYIGYTILRSHFEELYLVTEVPSAGVWGFAIDGNESVREIAKATANQTPFFSIHRRAAVRLNALSRQTIANFWCSRSLFESNKAAKRFLVIFRLKLIFDALQKRARRAVKFKHLLFLLYRARAVSFIKPHRNAT